MMMMMEIHIDEVEENSINGPKGRKEKFVV
jgi:hypothetical protein